MTPPPRSLLPSLTQPDIGLYFNPIPCFFERYSRPCRERPSRKSSLEASSHFGRRYLARPSFYRDVSASRLVPVHVRGSSAATPLHFKKADATPSQGRKIPQPVSSPSQYGMTHPPLWNDKRISSARLSCPLPFIEPHSLANSLAPTKDAETQ